MAETERKTEQAVIVVMGGEKSILPGIKIAERFAEFGICGLAISLFGADGLLKGSDRIPLEWDCLSDLRHKCFIFDNNRNSIIT